MELERNNWENCLSDSFWTRSEFNELLQEYVKEKGLDSVCFEVIRHNDDTHPNIYGKKIDGEHQFSREISPQQGLKIKCTIWSETPVKDYVEAELSNLIKNYLNVDCLDGTLLPHYEQSTEKSVRSLCEKTLQRLLKKADTVAIFMLDLDHFKEVNDTYDHEIGSSVLYEFGDLLLQNCEDRAIVLHRSGDEFFIMMPCTNGVEALELAYQIREASNRHPYKHVQDINLTVAQGICLLTDGTGSFQDAITRAESAYNPHGKNAVKNRDSVRMSCLNDCLPQRGPLNRDLALVLVKNGLADKCIFCNPYLDFISLYVSHISDNSCIQERLNHVIEWISPNQTTGMQFLGNQARMNYQCEWSSDELAFAVFHGLCRNQSICQGKCIQINFSETSPDFSVSLDKTAVYVSNAAANLSKVQSYQLTLPEGDIAKYETRTTVVVRIGYDELPVPDECFYRVIRIDARPTSGGNLPDFWEASLSELIELLDKKDFIKNILVYGKRDHGKKFCKILESCAAWGKEPYSFSFMAKKIRQPVERIQRCQERLNGHIHFINEGECLQLISKLKGFCQDDQWIISKSDPCGIEQHRFLERNLSYDQIRLGIEDGCRVDTMEEAFPTVLEILRKNSFISKHNCIKDQAARALEELPNFKIVIKKPSSKYIPEYYQGERDQLEEYYQSVFGGADGFFQKHLQEGAQYESVLNHIVNLIAPDGLTYATRRAVLIVPHNVEDTKDISPLGLVSIYIAPRRANDEIVFDFSFSWRTVEAVVGFPYSLYGSVRYAEQLFEEISHRCADICSARLKMGTLSYYAYSLHMFLDPSYLQIVRGIINDASK